MQQSLGLAVVMGVVAGASALSQTIHGREGITLPAPPAVEAIPVSDNYFGTKIPDSYRWLEDARSPETRAFIDAQNAYTARYLKQARIRPQAVDDMDVLENVSETEAPIERANSYFFSRRLAGEQQFSIYVRHGWSGKDERLIDPAKLTRDPNSSVGTADVSRDGTLLAYYFKRTNFDRRYRRLLAAQPETWFGDEGLFSNGKYTPWILSGRYLLKATAAVDPPPHLTLIFESFNGSSSTQVTQRVLIPDGHIADLPMLEQKLKSHCPNASVHLSTDH